MQVQHLGYRVRGFYRVARASHLWAMTTKDMTRRLEILGFFERHGKTATCDAFQILPRSLFGSNPLSLVASTAPGGQQPRRPHHALTLNSPVQYLLNHHHVCQRWWTYTAV